MRRDYEGWLKSRDYSANTVSTQLSGVRALERDYGDLAELHANGGLAAVADTLRYAKDDERRGRPNPSKIAVSGNVYNALASFRSALALYQRFLEENLGSAAIELVPIEPVQARERIGLERDLQKTLRAAIDQLEQGLQIIDGGAERAVASGLIDICAVDLTGKTVVIELKAGIADRAAIGQILSYMGDISDEEDRPARGILVAHGFDRKAISAARMVPNLTLRAYSVRFEFHEPRVEE
jgi:hypothetical protein